MYVHDKGRGLGYSEVTNVEVLFSTAISTEGGVEQVRARVVERRKRGRVERQSYTEGSSVALNQIHYMCMGKNSKRKREGEREVLLGKTHSLLS